jgi:cell division protein FtsQ
VVPRPTNKVLVRINHAWVLHKRLIQRILAVACIVFALFGLYQARDLIIDGGITAYKFVQGEFAAAGFGIDEIEISGQQLTSDADIATLLTVGAGNSTLTFDAQKAQARLEWLRAVKSATVRKVYPNRIVVSIVEKEPVVRWRVGTTTWLIDERGEKIGTDIASYTELPLVIGQGANNHAVPMVRLLARHPKLSDGLAALSRIGDRRWDLIYRNGLRVQLPETGVAQALARLDDYQREYALLDRDVTQIDLRVPGIISMKPGELAAQQIAATTGKKHKTKGSSEYETANEIKADAKVGMN